MRFRALFKIAFKSLLGKRLRSILTIGGVAVGIAAIVFLVSFAYGVQNLIVEKATGLEALKIIDVTSVNSKIVKTDEEAISKFKEIKSVTKAEPLVNIPGQISMGGSSTDIVCFGTTAEYLKLNDIKIKYGDKFKDQDKLIIVNTSILKLVGIAENEYPSAVGKEVALTLLIPADTLAEGEAVDTKKVEEKYTIAGVIDDTQNPYVFLPLKLLKDQGVISYSQVKVQVMGQEQVAEVRQIIESIGYKTNSAADTVAQINQIFSIFRVILSSFGAIALAVAALGMFNTLTVSLLERTREVGLMKALGAKKKDVFALFLIESLLISGVGGVLGIALGYGTGRFLNYLLNRLALATGNEPATIFSTPFNFVILIMGFALCIGLLTGVYPSKRASALNPLDALRYE